MTRAIVRTLMVVCTLEAASLMAIWLATGHWFSYQSFDAARRQQITAAAALMVDTPQKSTTLAVPHPFLGFTYDPGFDPEGTRSLHSVPVSEFGFLDDASPIQTRSSDKVIVGIFGGSVAFWTSVKGIDELRAALSQATALKHKTIVFVRTALGGFKQPQPLLTLSYLLSLGAEFDIVVNLDGFNEVALPVGNNIPGGYFPFYPQDWPALLGATGGPIRARLIGEVTNLERRRGAFAAGFSWPPLCWLVSANGLWMGLDRWIAWDIATRQASLASTQSVSLQYASKGPTRTYVDDEAAATDLVAMWQRSSREMRQLTAGQKGHYFHFLQPNQYVPGSKRIGSAEAAIALRPESPYAHAVERGYPKLIAAGRELAAEGLAFEDLTRIFAAIDHPLYADSCCHMTTEGYQLIGRAIGERIARWLDHESAAQ